MGSWWRYRRESPPVVLRFAQRSVADVRRRSCTPIRPIIQDEEDMFCRNEVWCHAWRTHARNPRPNWKPGVAGRGKRNATSCEPVRHLRIAVRCLHSPPSRKERTCAPRSSCESSRERRPRTGACPLALQVASSLDVPHQRTKDRNASQDNTGRVPRRVSRFKLHV